MLKRWAAVALVLVILGACSDEAPSPGDADRQVVQVLSGKVQPSGELTVSVDACQGAPEVSVDETDEAVRIEVVATVHAVGPACADGVAVPLEEALGHRPLIDAHTGETVEVVGAVPTFVFLRGVDPEAGTVTVDQAEWLSGEEARAAHREETGEPDGPPSDYYIRNTDTMEITYPVADDAVIIHRVPGTIETAQGSIEELHASWAFHPGHALYWVTVTDGVATRIEWQYTP